MELAVQIVEQKLGHEYYGIKDYALFLGDFLHQYSSMV